MREIHSEYMSDTFKDMLRSYCESVSNIRTKEQYIGYVRILCDKFVKKDFLDITDTDAVDAMSEMKRMIREGILSQKTVCVRLSCYKTISKFIENTYPAYEFKNPFKHIERPVIEDTVSRAKIPSLEELDKIMTVAKKTPMYYLIIAISTRTGMSASNILRINRDTLELCNGRYVVNLEDPYSEKKSRAVVLPEDVTELMEQYLESDHIKGLQRREIFINKHNKPLNLKTLEYNIAKIVEESGVLEDDVVNKTYTLKDMRSRAIMDMVDSGASEQDVQDYVGIGALRMQQFLTAKGVAKGCPADLVNYRVIS